MWLQLPKTRVNSNFWFLQSNLQFRIILNFRKILKNLTKQEVIFCKILEVQFGKIAEVQLTTLLNEPPCLTILERYFLNYLNESNCSHYESIVFLCFNLGILGALALQEMVPSSKKKNLAMTKLSVKTTLARGIGFEMIFSFIYALVFFASTNSRLTFKGFGGPLAIGLFYGVSHVITVKVFCI